jgi:diguanylate cyclase (GGDEF)-like protein
MDLVMLIVVVAAMYRQADGEVSLPVFLLGLGTAAIAVSDTLYVHLATVQSYDPTGNPVEFGWVVGYALFALSGAVQLRHGGSRESPAVGMPAGHSALSFVVPYLISVPVLVLLATTSLSGSADPAITAGACILVLGIALRQWITILELRDRERLIRHMAYHDPLTELPNRALLEDRASQAIAYAGRHNSGLAFLSIDLDKFKIVNDACGHLFGDKFLRAVATAIRMALRETDTVARVGGDEFVVLLPGVDSAIVASAVSQKVLAGLQSLEVDGRPFPTRASIGASLYPYDGASTEELWSRADAAMYTAKQGGRAPLKVYQAGAGPAWTLANAS